MIVLVLGWKSLLEEGILPPPHSPPPPGDGAGLLENPLPARATHLSLGGGRPPPETRRPSGPKDPRVFLLVIMVGEGLFGENKGRVYRIGGATGVVDGVGVSAGWKRGADPWGAECE